MVDGGFSRSWEPGTTMCLHDVGHLPGIDTTLCFFLPAVAAGNVTMSAAWE